MYYSFYCNEKMLLDNFSDYNESPRLLRRLLAQSGYAPDFCADMQLKYTNPDYIQEYDRLDLIQKYERIRLNHCGLRQVNEITLYNYDIEYIKLATRSYNLTQRQVKVLTGVIVMCRINDNDTLDLMNKYRIKQFCSCFGKDVTAEYIKGDTWWNGYEAPVDMNVLSDGYGIIDRVSAEVAPNRIGCLFRYPFFEQKDSVAYTYKVTPQTNKLDMNRVCADIGLLNYKYCEKCGEKIEWGVRTHYCKACAELEKNAKALARVTKHRAKNDTL